LSAISIEQGRFGAPLVHLTTGGKGELQFEIDNQLYVLNFVPAEGRWYVFSPTEDGLIRIPVAMDAAPLERFPAAPGEGGPKVVH
jgi:hypothetical protein